MPSSSLQLVPTASADDLRGAAAPSDDGRISRRNGTASTDDAYDSDDEPDLTHECFKLMVLVGLIVALVLLNKEVGAALLTMKNWLLKHIPLYAYFLGYVAVQGCRRLLPPLYYAMPIGLLTIFYLVARLGWLRAGFLYQAWQMLDCVWFVGIRYVYTDKVALVLDKSREGKKIRRYLPRDVVRLLRVLDREWKRRISTGDYSVAWRVVTVALLGSAYGCDEMVTLYFLATRCDASLAFFAVAWLATQLLQLPSALVRAYTVQSFVGALAEDDWGILGSAFRKAPVALVVVWVVVAVVATVAVHSVHCKLLWEHAPSSPRSPRTARRAELVAHQRRNLSP